MPDRPNIVLIVMDTARFDAVDTDSTAGPTPTIASLAQEGTEYTQAFSSAPWTLPSHASLFTGVYSSKHGAHAGHKRLDGHHRLAESFADAGYETVGASNNAWISEAFGYGEGFETFFKGWQYVQANTDFGKAGLTNNGLDMWKAAASRIFSGNPLINAANALYAKFDPDEDDGAARTTDWIGDWLESRSTSRPFFMFVNYLEPHLEYRPPEAHAMEYLPESVSYEAAMSVPQNAWEYITDQQELSDRDFEILRALYTAELAYLDEKISAVQDHLESAGEWKDTVLIVTGDHGENIGDHGLMDHQYNLYDTLLHVPLVVGGGSFTDGGQVDDLVQIPDLVPTLLDEADLNASALREQCQGKSFHPNNSNEPREHIISEYMAPQPSQEAIENRVGDPHGVMKMYDRSLRCIRTADHKLIVGSDGSREFYSLDGDGDIGNSIPIDDTARTLEAQLNEWLNTFEHADTAGDVSMDSGTKERLEDLGYLQ